MSALEVQSVLQKMVMMRDDGGGWPLGAQHEFQELYVVLEKVQRKVTHAEPLVDSGSSAAYSRFLAELRPVALAVDEALDRYSASAIRSPLRHKLRGLLAKAFFGPRTSLGRVLSRSAIHLLGSISILHLVWHICILHPGLISILRPVMVTEVVELLRHSSPALRPKIASQFQEAGKDLRMLLRLFTTYVADLLPPPPPELQRQDSGRSNSNSTAPKNKSALSLSMSQEHGLIGRSHDQETVSRLLREGDAGVVAIVGMAGVGKTALARAVYLAAEDDGFDHTLWVDVCQDFNPERIFTMLMSELKKQLQRHEDPESYWWSVNEGLINKRYLLVLDDVWNEDTVKWNQLMRLIYGNVMNRGKILVTTRILGAATAIRAAETYHLRPLTVEDTLKLLRKNNKRRLKQLLKRNKKSHKGQRNAAMSAAAAETSNKRQVAESCSGLPCIINFMRRSLAAICENEDPLSLFDSLCAGNEELQRIAQASYDYLPADLQRCFLYCSLFPHDHIFDAEEMTGLMVAEGLTQISIREAGQKGGGFTRFLAECFEAVEKPGSGGEVGYRMHRVLHILARHKEKGHGLYKAITGYHSNSLKEHSNIRYLSLMVDGTTKELSRSLIEQKDLRTLILLREQQMVLSCSKSQIREIPSDYCRYFTSLRILDMQATMIDKLPQELDMLSNLRYLNLAQTEIAKLPESLTKLQSLIYLNISQTRITAVDEYIGKIHPLRYLNISQTVIRKLPESIGTLRLLQTLQLSHCERLLKLPRSIASLTSLQKLHLQGCQYLSEMPQDIRSMKSLKELNILDCYSLDKMPSGLSALTKIEALPRYITTSSSNNPILELQGLGNLKRLGLEYIEEMSVEDAAEVQLHEKHKLEHLTLHCNKDAEGSSPEVTEKLLDNLKPNPGLKTLEIICYAGQRFPCWMPNKDPHLKKLTHIRLVNLRCERLPALGQLPHLTTLEISGMNAIKHVSKELNGEPTDSNPKTFCSLKSIIFSQMINLESWREDGATCPCLEELSVIQCPKFQKPSMKLPVRNLTVSMSSHLLLTEEGLAGVADSLKSLSISLCEELSASGSMDLTVLSSLEELVISGSDELESLPPCAENLASLKSVKILGCSRFHDLTDLLKYRQLRYLRISGCPKVTSIPTGLKGITTWDYNRLVTPQSG